LDGVLQRAGDDSVRIAALGCVGAVLGSVDPGTAARELSPFLASSAQVEEEKQPEAPSPSAGEGLIGCSVIKIAREGGSAIERMAALDVLGRLGRVFPLARHLWPQPLLPVFTAALRCPDSSIRYHALSALATLTKPPKVHLLTYSREATPAVLHICHRAEERRGMRLLIG
jgi:hypothetical protein